MDSIFFLLVFAAYSAFVLYATRWAMRRASIPWKKTALKIALPVVLLLAPVADGIYGYATLQYLCATEAKTEVLRPIRIPAEYFNADGSPRFRYQGGRYVDWRVLRDALEIKDTSKKNFHARNLERFVQELIDVQSRETLARQTLFYYRGGWLRIGEWKTWSDRCIPEESFSDMILRTGLRK